jgi:hypothetical protein
MNIDFCWKEYLCWSVGIALMGCESSSNEILISEGVFMDVGILNGNLGHP